MLFTVQDFKESSDVDIESYLFFDTVLNRKVTKIHIDLNQEKIESYLTKSIDEIDFEDREIAKIIKSKGGVNVVSDTDLYNKLRQKQTSNIKLDELPSYLFLGDVDESYCKEIEQMFGIHCYSTKRMKVPSEFRIVVLEKLENTNRAIFNKLGRNNFHRITIHDPYFFESKENDDRKATSLVAFSILQRYALPQINISVKASLKSFDNGLYERKRDLIQAKIKEMNTSNCKIEFSSSLDAKHDRLICTNREMMIIGNSLFTTSETHFTSYPIGIYHDYFD